MVIIDVGSDFFVLRVPLAAVFSYCSHVFRSLHEHNVFAELERRLLHEYYACGGGRRNSTWASYGLAAMPPSQSDGRSTLVNGPGTRLTPAVLPSDYVGLDVRPSLLVQDQPESAKKANRTRCPNTSDQYSTEPERLVVPCRNPSPRSTRSTSARAASQTLPHEKAALLKATFILNGTPILMSRKIASHNPGTELHNLDLVSLELLSTKKKTLPFQSALVQTTILSSIHEEDHGYSAPLPPSTAIRPLPRREGEDLAARLLTTLDDSLGDKAILPPFEGRRVYMHYTDNEVSPEEKMAKMARYAYTPARATDTMKAKR